MNELTEILLRWVPLVLQALLFWVMWSLSQKFVSRENFEKHRKSLMTQAGEVDRRISKTEKELTLLPTRRDIIELNNNMAKLNKELGETQGRLKGIGRATDIMNQYLIAKGKN